MTNDKQRERLVELLQEASTEAGKHFRETVKKVVAEKGRFNSAEDIDRRNIYEVEADYLLANGVLCKPFKIGEMVDVFFSHNAIVHIWCIKPDEEQYSISLWRGMAWDIPKEYTEIEFKKFFGTVPGHLHEADAINILVNLSREEAEAKLKAGVQG